jgi:hypothetical protein
VRPTEHVVRLSPHVTGPVTEAVIRLPERTQRLAEAIADWASAECEHRGRLPEWLEISTAVGIVRLETRR